jgi:hypothetical protein
MRRRTVLVGVALVGALACSKKSAPPAAPPDAAPAAPPDAAPPPPMPGADAAPPPADAAPATHAINPAQVGDSFDGPRVQGPVTTGSDVTLDGVDGPGGKTIGAKIQSAYAAGMRRCYDDALKTNATQKGRVTLDFTITTTGTVRNVNASQTGDLSTDVGMCVAARAKSWKFPAQKADTQFTARVIFRPKE